MSADKQADNDSQGIVGLAIVTDYIVRVMLREQKGIWHSGSLLGCEWNLHNLNMSPWSE